MNIKQILLTTGLASALVACENRRQVQETEKIPHAANLPADTTEVAKGTENATIADRIKQYAPVRLTADLSKLTAKEKQMIPLLLDCAQIIDYIFKKNTYNK